jgi:hypothetical protein
VCVWGGGEDGVEGETVSVHECAAPDPPPSFGTGGVGPAQGQRMVPFPLVVMVRCNGQREAPGDVQRAGLVLGQCVVVVAVPQCVSVLKQRRGNPPPTLVHKLQPAEHVVLVYVGLSRQNNM